MSALIAVQGCTLSFDALNTGVITITSNASTKSFYQTSGVYAGSISFTVSGVTNVSVSGTAGTGTGTITATALKSIVDNQFPVRQGDNVTIVVSGTISGNPGTWPAQITVTNAGQTKLLCA